MRPRLLSGAHIIYGNTMQKTLLFCTGLSGSGKSYFIKHFLPDGKFHNLTSATTRPMRNGEQNGREYYFCSQEEFEKMPLATQLWVNEAFWTPEKPKWMYGVPEFEILNNLHRNLVYDVIQPKYARQMINWFIKHKIYSYDFKTIYFMPPENNFDIANRRANMPDDEAVRRANTCTPNDFLNAGLDIDFVAKCNATQVKFSPKLCAFLQSYEKMQ